MSRRPRLLFFAHSLGIGGIERSLLGLLRAMPLDRLEVDLLLLEPHGALSTHLPPEVRLVARDPAYGALAGSMRRAIFSPHFAIGVARLAARAVLCLRALFGLPPGDLLARSHRYAASFLPDIPGHYDLAISFWEPHDIVSVKVAADRKVGWVHTDHTSLETGVAAAFDEKAWAAMHLIVAVSPDVAMAFGKVFPALQSRLRVIENILDPEWVRQRASEKVPVEMQLADVAGLIRLCSVGRITHQKGFDIAVEAARILKDHGVVFKWYIIGFGPDEAAIRAQVDEFGLAQEVVLLGARENPYPYIKECDIYVQPSRYEGKAVSVREAQILGKPVLISEFPTVRSQVNHGVDGFIVPAGAKALATGVRKLALDPVLRAQLAQATASCDYGNLLEAQKVIALIPGENA